MVDSSGTELSFHSSLGSSRLACIGLGLLQVVDADDIAGLLLPLDSSFQTLVGVSVPFKLAALGLGLHTDHGGVHHALRREDPVEAETHVV